MPNTLAHIGIQSVLGRAIVPMANLHWVLMSCIVPDVPWMLQKLLRSMPVTLDLIDMRTYAIAQSSLLFCLILAAALAFSSRTVMGTFGILASGSLLHLLLDATQIKWGNGVILFAPFDWSLKSFELYWPEQAPSQILTAFGAIWIVTLWVRKGPEPIKIPKFSKIKCLLSAACVVAWVVGPLFLKSTVESKNLHDTQTLRKIEERAGKSIAIDRNNIIDSADGSAVLSLWTGEVLNLSSDEKAIPAEGLISIKGVFENSNTVIVTNLYQHQENSRDRFAYAGLLIILLWWTHGVVRGLRKTPSL